MVEAIYLAPDFLENLVSHNLLDPGAGSEIRVELLCQIPLECSIPEVSNILSTTIIAGFGFEQCRLCHQCTMLPALPLLVELLRKRAQMLVLLRHVLVLDKIPLIKIVDVIQEELHLPCFLGQDEPALVLCHSVAESRPLASRLASGRHR